VAVIPALDTIPAKLTDVVESLRLMILFRMILESALLVRWKPKPYSVPSEPCGMTVRLSKIK
jgi:hypothetical protein